jgi:hypothetical protein
LNQKLFKQDFMTIRNIASLLSLSVLVGVTGCKKSFLDTKPTDQVALSDAFKTTKGCKAAVQGMSRLMFNSESEEAFGEPSIMMMEDMMGEDMPISTLNWLSGNYDYTDARAASGTAGHVWALYYRIISNANLLLANVDKAEGPEEDRKFIKGQGLFYRAYAYYKLTLYYQQTYRGVGSTDYGFTGSFIDQPGVPIYTTPTQVGNPRPTLRENYAQIVKDLDDALVLLPEGLRVDKTDPDISVAKGLYARVALVMQDWDKAAQMAAEARQDYPLAAGSQLMTGFNDINNSEWIWGCSINAEQTGIYASFLSNMVYESGGYAVPSQKLGYKPMCDSLQRVGAADSLDVRKDWWYKATGMPSGRARYAQRKFKVKKEGSWVGDLPFMRSSEMALIEAEAKAQDGDVGGAGDVLEALIKIRNPNFTAKTTRIELIRQIWWQRRIELWGEGFRLSDIKRQMAFSTDIISEQAKGRHSQMNGLPSNHNTSYMGSAADLTPYSRFFLFRIPGSELNNNKSFTGADQNP